MGGGFYKKEGKVIKVFDVKMGIYVDLGVKVDEMVGCILKCLLVECLKLLCEMDYLYV